MCTIDTTIPGSPGDEAFSEHYTVQTGDEN